MRMCPPPASRLSISIHAPQRISTEPCVPFPSQKCAGHNPCRLPSPMQEVDALSRDRCNRKQFVFHRILHSLISLTSSLQDVAKLLVRNHYVLTATDTYLRGKAPMDENRIRASTQQLHLRAFEQHLSASVKSTHYRLFHEKRLYLVVFMFYLVMI